MSISTKSGKALRNGYAETPVFKITPGSMSEEENTGASTSMLFSVPAGGCHIRRLDARCLPSDLAVCVISSDYAAEGPDRLLLMPLSTWQKIWEEIGRATRDAVNRRFQGGTVKNLGPLRNSTLPETVLGALMPAWVTRSSARTSRKKGKRTSGRRKAT